MPDSHFTLERRPLADDVLELRLAGAPRFSDAARLWDELAPLLQRPPARLQLDLAGLERLDGACAALLLAARDELTARGCAVALAGAAPGVADMLARYERIRRDPQPPPRRVPVLAQIGAVTADLLAQARGGLEYLGRVVAAAAGALAHPGSVNWADVPRLMERTGADGLPIVALIAFLFGLVSAFQAAATLDQYGANLYVADLVGLSICRVMGPLMTAILVTGRSGAGFAAELGTMKVSEELDALAVLRLDPVRYLVLPRLLALLLVVPLLSLLADVVGVAGGLLIGVTVLDVTLPALLSRLRVAVGFWDVGTGLILSVAYALAIGLVACERGLTTRGGAEGVGRATTSAVVSILFSLVLLTSVLTILFQTWGI